MHSEIYLYQSSSGWNNPLNKKLDSPHTLVLAFGTAETTKIEKAITEVLEAFPESIVIGCSTSGEIHQDDVFDDSLSVSVTQFARTQIQTAEATINATEESYFAGQHLATSLDADDLRGVLIFSDGLIVNGSKLLEAFNPLTERNVVVTGGLAGDGSRFEKTWVLSNGKTEQNKVCAVGLYGDAIKVHHGSRGGWDIKQSELTVTHAIGNVLYELNDEPALEVYKKVMGEAAAELPSSGLLYPLALIDPEAEDGYTVRTILGIDEAEGSINFAGNIPDQAQAHLMTADFSNLIKGAETAAQDAKKTNTEEEPVLAVVISCVGRRLVLAEQANKELEAVLTSLPEHSQQIGFYSYGEISPLVSGRCELHNQTMTLTLISESL